MSRYAVFRLVTLVSTTVFAFIVMCLSADLLSFTGPLFPLSGLALFTALFTLVLLVPILVVVDLLQKETILSRIVIEVICLTILWIFWLSSAAYAAWIDSAFGIIDPSSCGPDLGCHEIQAIAALSFITWIQLFAYSATLLWFAFQAQTADSKVWVSSVRDGIVFHPTPKIVEEPAHGLDTYRNQEAAKSQQIPTTV
ncbi:hypothetical protein B0F90DRAFT_256528 [Multifurca ochricompacta]|uniref:MARVEL domain-containing protein n=1 Tax=Multifurca ochricompacta TaxID=376703 RepID=A0AAD4M4P9_9AGAM|nr:hypothetical protein B0F90DRAFT_256528 [Multifurca ochricompacta]